MMAGRIYYQIVFSTSFGVALTLALIVLAYLKSKPTGMQDWDLECPYFSNFFLEKFQKKFQKFEKNVYTTIN
jgi:hypothetical protein